MEQTLIIHQGSTKWDIRQRVWDYIEAKNLANFPRPVHHRIPNFKRAAQGCNRLLVLQEFMSSSVVKVNPDRPQEQARFNTLTGAEGACSKIVSLDVFSKTTEVKVDPDKPLEGARLAALQARKVLLVPTPRLRTGLFNKIVPPQSSTKEDLRVCSTSQGVKDFSVPIGLDANVQVDLVVVGSVAVSEKGYRIGKGEGFADMEYGMMAAMGAVNESTVVVTVVHDCQVMDIPEGLSESHDLTVDYILTPTRIIKTECKHPRPQGIIWSKWLRATLVSQTLGLGPLRIRKGMFLDFWRLWQFMLHGRGELDAEMLEKIPILKKLRVLEQKAGKDVTLKSFPATGWIAQDVSEPMHLKPGLQPDPKGSKRFEGGGMARGPPHGPISTLYLGGIPAGLRVGELKCLLRERCAMPLRLTWQGPRHRAFLDYSDGSAADRALAALQGLSINGHTLQGLSINGHTLQGLSINGHTLQAERARGRRDGRRAGQAPPSPGDKEAKVTAPTTAATNCTVSTTVHMRGGGGREEGQKKDGRLTEEGKKSVR